MIHGEKGTGKTSFAMGFDGIKVVLNTDDKALRVKERMLQEDESVKIYDALQHYRGVAKEKMPDMGCKSIDFLIALLNHIPMVDWVIFDGVDLFIEMAEMRMRHDHGLGPFDGVEFQIWKDRRANLREIHGLALSKVRKGIVYTGISGEDELVESGTLVKKGKKPKWVDIILTSTDNVVRMEMRKHNKLGTRFIAVMETVKVGPWQNGSELDVTETTLSEATFETQKGKQQDAAKVEALFG